MDFKAQTRRAWIWGAVTLLVLVALPAAVFSRGMLVDGVILLGLAIGMTLIVFIGIARPLHRWVWFRILQPWALGRQFRANMLQGPLVGPVLQRWLHLTPQGADRDTAS